MREWILQLSVAHTGRRTAHSLVYGAADTRDVAGTVEEVKRCVDAGAEIVRITVQGKKEAAACMAIREALFRDRCAVQGLCAIAFLRLAVVSRRARKARPVLKRL